MPRPRRAPSPQRSQKRAPSAAAGTRTTAQRTAWARAGQEIGQQRPGVGGGGAHAHARRDGLGDRGQRPGGRARLALGDGRDADVPALADGDVERHAAEVLEAVLRGEPLAATAAEDLGQLAAVRAGERGHVLDEADDRHAHPLEHRERLAPRRSGETSWGVVTSTAPLIGTAWARVSWASDVPGGRSMTR